MAAVGGGKGLRGPLIPMAAAPLPFSGLCFIQDSSATWIATARFVLKLLAPIRPDPWRVPRDLS